MNLCKINNVLGVFDSSPLTSMAIWTARSFYITSRGGFIVHVYPAVKAGYTNI